MSGPERIAELSRRADRQREQLATSLSGVASDVREHRTRCNSGGMPAPGAAAAGTVAYRLFGKSSPAARIGRAASATSILLGLGRAFLRLRKFL